MNIKVFIFLGLLVVAGIVVVYYASRRKDGNDSMTTLAEDSCKCGRVTDNSLTITKTILDYKESDGVASFVVTSPESILQSYLIEGSIDEIDVLLSKIPVYCKTCNNSTMCFITKDCNENAVNVLTDALINVNKKCFIADPKTAIIVMKRIFGNNLRQISSKYALFDSDTGQLGIGSKDDFEKLIGYYVLSASTIKVYVVGNNCE
jgi:hypothetical protein